jgi:hypothetical protein
LRPGEVDPAGVRRQLSRLSQRERVGTSRESELSRRIVGGAPDRLRDVGLVGNSRRLLEVSQDAPREWRVGLGGQARDPPRSFAREACRGAVAGLNQLHAYVEVFELERERRGEPVDGGLAPGPDQFWPVITVTPVTS